MDKLIKKVGKDLKKGQKDVKVLLKADKKFDRKLDLEQLERALNIIKMLQGGEPESENVKSPSGNE